LPDAYGTGQGIKLNNNVKTNVSDSDEAEFVSVGNLVRVNIPALAANSSALIEFKVKIK